MQLFVPWRNLQKINKVVCVSWNFFLVIYFSLCSFFSYIFLLLSSKALQVQFCHHSSLHTDQQIFFIYIYLSVWRQHEVNSIFAGGKFVLKSNNVMQQFVKLCEFSLCSIYRKIVLGSELSGVFFVLIVIFHATYHVNRRESQFWATGDTQKTMRWTGKGVEWKAIQTPRNSIWILHSLSSSQPQHRQCCSGSMAVGWWRCCKDSQVDEEKGKK